MNHEKKIKQIRKRIFKANIEHNNRWIDQWNIKQIWPLYGSNNIIQFISSDK